MAAIKKSKEMVNDQVFHGIFMAVDGVWLTSDQFNKLLDKNPWEFGWDALVAIGTLVLAIITGILAFATFLLGKDTRDLGKVTIDIEKERDSRERSGALNLIHANIGLLLVFLASSFETLLSESGGITSVVINRSRLQKICQLQNEFESLLSNFQEMLSNVFVCSHSKINEYEKLAEMKFLIGAIASSMPAKIQSLEKLMEDSQTRNNFSQNGEQINYFNKQLRSNYMETHKWMPDLVKLFETQELNERFKLYKEKIPNLQGEQSDA